MVKVKCIVQMLNDLDARKQRKYGEEFIVTDERAKYLSGDNANKIKAVEILEVIPDKEEKPEKVEEKPKKDSKKQTKKIDKKK